MKMKSRHILALKPAKETDALSHDFPTLGQSSDVVTAAAIFFASKKQGWARLIPTRFGGERETCFQEIQVMDPTLELQKLPHVMHYLFKKNGVSYIYNINNVV